MKNEVHCFHCFHSFHSLPSTSYISTCLANSRKAIMARSYNVVLPSLFVIGAVQNCRLEIMFVCVCVVFLLETLRLQNSVASVSQRNVLPGRGSSRRGGRGVSGDGEMVTQITGRGSHNTITLFILSPRTMAVGCSDEAGATNNKQSITLKAKARTKRL